MRRRAGGILAVAVLTLVTACLPAQPDQAAGISILAPADPGGGWDTTARAMQQALESAVPDQHVEVYNVGGAGGTIGLAGFVNDPDQDQQRLMVTGLVMIGAIRAYGSPATLADVTPIAALATEYEGVAVPAHSPYHSIQDLIAAFRADPAAISWAGGSAGGTDHMLVGLIAAAAGVDPAAVTYVAHAGGGEALAAVLSGAVSAGVSGVSEFADQVEAGQLRLLAVSSGEPIDGVDAPTLRAAGLAVELSNWRGVVGPPGMTPEQRSRMLALVERMRASSVWQQALRDHGWTDFFVTGDEFAAFLDDEAVRVERILAQIGLIT